MKIITPYQAAAPKTVKIDAEAWKNHGCTEVYWLGSAGVLINSHGTIIMVDATLLPTQDISLKWATRIKVGVGDEDPHNRVTKILNEPPISIEDIPHIDALCITHADDDHMGPATIKSILNVTSAFYGPHYVAQRLERLGAQPEKVHGLDIGDTFVVGNVKITTTIAYHSYQQGDPNAPYVYALEDCCGFLIDTPDGRIWVPGDSRLLHEHLEMKNENIDMVFMDFSDDNFHWGRANSIRLANHLEKSDLVMYHYGTVSAPFLNCYNADPDDVRPFIVNPERLHVVGAGEKLILTRKYK